MVQKILQVGSSAAVTLPKKSLENLGLRIGDRVNVSLDTLHKRMTIEPSVEISSELVDWTKKFIHKYKDALETLARE